MIWNEMTMYKNGMNMYKCDDPKLREDLCHESHDIWPKGEKQRNPLYHNPDHNRSLLIKISET